MARINKIKFDGVRAVVYTDDLNTTDATVIAVEINKGVFYGDDVLVIKMVPHESMKDGSTHMTRKQAEETFNIKLVD